MNSRRIPLLALAAACLAMVSCRPKDTISDPPKEILKMGQLIGRWKSTVHSLAPSINAQSIDQTLTFECAWTLDKFYVACMQIGVVDGKRLKEVDLYGYSEKAQMYNMLIVLNDSQDVPKVTTKWFTWDKDGWHFVARDGARSTWVFDSPDHHTVRTERSADGVHWTEVATGEHTRLN